MRRAHLTEDELDTLLVEGGASSHLEEHLAGCVYCRGRHDRALALLRPGEDEGCPAWIDRAREAAVETWAATVPVSRRTVRWRRLAMAAVLALLVVGAVVLRERSPRPDTVDTLAVLEEVDRVLASDPLSAFASEDVVQAVVPVESTGEGS